MVRRQRWYNNKNPILRIWGIKSNSPAIHKNGAPRLHTDVSIWVVAPHHFTAAWGTWRLGWYRYGATCASFFLLVATKRLSVVILVQVDSAVGSQSRHDLLLMWARMRFSHFLRPAVAATGLSASQF